MSKAVVNLSVQFEGEGNSYVYSLVIKPGEYTQNALLLAGMLGVRNLTNLLGSGEGIRALVEELQKADYLKGVMG